MVWDILLAVGIGATQLAITVYVVIVSIKENRIKTAVTIGIVGLLGIGLTVVGTVRNVRSQNKLVEEIRTIREDVNKNQNASVGLYDIQPHYNLQVLAANKPLEFNVKYLVITNTAKNFRVYFEMKISEGPPTLLRNRALMKEFKRIADEQLERVGQERIAGSGDYKTVSVTPLPKDMPGIYSGTKTIYVLGAAKWVNPSGSDGQLDTCSSMEKPKEHAANFLGWHDCEL